MKKTICMMLCMLLLFAAPAALAAQITVQGTAEVTASPDIVSVTANASVSAQTVGRAQEQINAIIAAATGKLLELGVHGEDIVTTNYSCYPRYDYENNTISDYEANHTIEITCQDVEMLDAVISAITDSGVSQIYNVSYGLSNQTELYEKALDLAIRRAEEKAVRMAATSGQTIIGLASLAENGAYSAGYFVNGTYDMEKMTSGVSGATGIRSGTVSVSASVTAIYETQAK